MLLNSTVLYNTLHLKYRYAQNPQNSGCGLIEPEELIHSVNRKQKDRLWEILQTYRFIGSYSLSTFF